MAPSPDRHGPDRGFPQTFGRYRLLAPIAMGGMAEVFLAEMMGPLGFRRRVAIKRILPHLAQNREFVRAFVDEARVGGLLVHPNIIQILDFDFVGSVPYLAMEYVDGGHFGQILGRVRRRRTHPPPGCIVALFIQVGRGLEWAHQAHDVDGAALNLIHRDLKPSNMLLGFNGHVKIADFGIAKASSNLTQTLPCMVKGSLPYMSPEQASGSEPLTQSSDLFAIGAVLFEFLTLERLYGATTSAMGLLGTVARGPSPDRLALLERLPRDAAPLAPVARCLLAKRASDRYPDASALVSALEKLDIPQVSREDLAKFATRWLSPDAETTSRQFILPRDGHQGQASVAGPKPAAEIASQATLSSPSPPAHAQDITHPPPAGVLQEAAAERRDGKGRFEDEIREGQRDESPPLSFPSALEPTPGPDRDKERQPADASIPGGQAGAPTSATATPPDASHRAALSMGVEDGSKSVLAKGSKEEVAGHPPGTALSRPTRVARHRGSRRRAIITFFAGCAIVLAALSTWLLLREPPEPIVTAVTDSAARSWLYVVASTPDATVFVGDEPAGRAPLQVGLRNVSGVIHVRVEAPGAAPGEWSGRPNPGEHVVLDFGKEGSPKRWLLPAAPWESPPKPSHSG